ncbi:MAG: hypothetical protein Q7U97_09320 [Rhodocyclaceae bacterium]|nr:hypothetical protein [Rhodocyclaceae bacterium]
MIAETILRLAAVEDAFKLVEGAADLEAAMKARPKAVPAAYVIPLREVGGKSPTYSRTRQKVATTFGVVYAVSNVADGKGVAAQADLVTLRGKTFASLIGWSPAGADPLEFDTGVLLALKDGVLWWQDAFRTQTAISSI